LTARLLTIASAVVATAVLATAGATDAAAAGPALTPGASAYSAAAGTGTASLQANLHLTGSLGGLLDWAIDPIVNDALNPLVAALQGSVDDAVDAALGASSSLNAATVPTQQQVSPGPSGTFPNDSWPATCVATGDQPCYRAASTSVNGAPLASIGLGLVTGYAEQVQTSADASNPIFARASAATPQVSALPAISSLANPVVSAGLVNAKATCPNDGSVGATKPATAPSVNISATGVTLLGGLVSFGAVNGGLTSLTVNGVSYPDVLHLPTVTVGNVTISPYGGSVLISIPLTVNQVLAGLGLPTDVVSQLTGLSPTSSVSLSLVVGPNSTVTNRTASAWGLGIGVDLSGSLTFNLLNVVTAKVNIPTGIGHGNYGNLLDLRLGYATCQSGINVGSGAGGVPPIPPALV
jgi:hypothetical protein